MWAPQYVKNESFKHVFTLLTSIMIKVGFRMKPLACTSPPYAITFQNLTPKVITNYNMKLQNST